MMNNVYKSIYRALSIYTIAFMQIASSAEAQSYDRFAHIGLLPTAPLMVTSEHACRDLEQQISKKIIDISTAHDQCLQAEGGGGYNLQGIDSKSKCTKPACQGLHDGRDEAREHLGQQSALCRARYAEYQQEQQKKADVNRKQEIDRSLARSKYDNCITERKQYEALCVGEYESYAQEKACKEQLRRIRRDCR